MAPRSGARARRARAPFRGAAPWLLCIAGAAALAAPAAGDSAYLESLLARADALRLADDPTWNALLHYRPPRLGGGVRSLADDPSFFLAPDGRTDPRAELAATLRRFFDPPPADPQAEHEAQHPQCRFVARYRWLSERLAFDPDRLPPIPCPRFEAWFASFTPERLTLVFPEAFMNNPASMFGHTLLRVDATADAGRRDLLAYAINFAAYTGGESGALFAVKGIAGRYPGYFSIAPYYEKVKEYGDWENRDIWEYPLDFTREEIERVLRHLWELDRVRFDYWFFDENCSYQLLDLLEVGRPGMRLIQGNPFYLIPSDSVRTVVAKAGLQGNVTWRASADTQLRTGESALSAEDQERVLQLASGRLDPEGDEIAALPDARRAAVLGLAYDLLRHRFLSQHVTRAESVALSRRLLEARSHVPIAGEPTPPPAQPAVRPDQGHGTARIAVESGYWDHEPYVELRIRPAFHGLLDPEGGYTRGAEIQFLDTAVRILPEEGRVRLQEVVLLDVLSLAARDRIFEPISWRFDTGLRTRLLPEHGSRLEPEPVWHNRAGAGVAYQLGPALAYAMGEASFDAAPALADGCALGPGAELGLYLTTPSDLWKGHLFARTTGYAVGDRTVAASAGIEQRIRVGATTAVELHATLEHAYSESWIEAGVRWSRFF